MKLSILHICLVLLYSLLTCKVGSEGVVGLWVVDQTHQGLDDLLSLGRGLPVLRRHDGETHLALLVNVGVVDLGSE